ncbi:MULTISPECIES: hypothetical protein [Morganellaceae]|uniref:Uncharacterized protein n=3 Tax=Morganellaceae TaxID=1903414 RepID=A0A1B8HD11_9GAMM|nr:MULTISPECIES: hypothetical protein [Morganellaceae]QCJ72286.1 hypothetical protein C9446_21045 [Providencia heimbachae]OBU06945.1 hypothetical protein AYY17_19600 [Morganella psychrotolerans]UNH29120.1 hypothetical protein MNY64_16355 [Moellerella wisconsensis]UNH32610.1 hypothetical protein MNY72_16430 [Moellerella wisconsensis]UNH40701.1 hypothetical protein MNY70_17850 [Moellerella wisconsensis]
MGQFGEQLKLYSDRQQDEKKRTALDVQYAKSEGKEGFLTLNISIAPMFPEGRDVNWEQKITIQLSRYELTAFCGALFALEKEMRAKFHGENKNKGFVANNNGALGCGLTISEAGTTMTFMLDHARRIELGAFVLRRQAEAWKMSASDVLAIMRQSVSIKKQ